MTDLIEVEQEILEEIIEAKEALSAERHTLPSTLDAERIIGLTKRSSKFHSYFTPQEEADKLIEKEQYITIPGHVKASVLVEYEFGKDTEKEAKEIESKLDVMQLEIVQRLTKELDKRLEDHPSIKIAKKLFIVVDDELASDKIVVWDTDTNISALKYQFVLKMTLYVG